MDRLGMWGAVAFGAAREPGRGAAQVRALGKGMCPGRLAAACLTSWMERRMPLPGGILDRRRAGVGRGGWGRVQNFGEISAKFRYFFRFR